MTEEEILKNVIDEQVAQQATQEEQVDENANPATQYLGTKLQHEISTGRTAEDLENDKNFAARKGLSRVGDKISTVQQPTEIQEGWIPVDRELLGERSVFYPESWEFYIRPATVEAIRNWSTINDENPNSVNEVFNEIIKSCVSIKNGEKKIPWGNINFWDRFFFILLVREYTFAHGENKIEYTDPCQECGNDVTFNLTSQSLLYEMPDPSIMHFYDQETQTWVIDPQEYDIDADVLKFHLFTLEKDAAITSWIVSRYRENNKFKPDEAFIRILPWLATKLSKDENLIKMQIREYEAIYKRWDMEMFGFVNDIVRNIIVQPSTNLIAECPICGEEVTSQIRFPNSISSLFAVSNRHKKFGTK